MARYEVTIALTLYLMAKLTVEAKDTDVAHAKVQEMIEAGTFLITDWKVETDPDHELNEVQLVDQIDEIESVAEIEA